MVAWRIASEGFWAVLIVLGEVEIIWRSPHGFVRWSPGEAICGVSPVYFGGALWGFLIGLALLFIQLVILLGRIIFYGV